MLLRCGVLLVALCALSVCSADGEEVPKDQRDLLDPQVALETAEGTSGPTYGERAALEAMNEADDHDQQQRAAPRGPESDVGESYSGGNPHEDQMDDLFGDMREQQDEELEKERIERHDKDTFKSAIPKPGHEDDRLVPPDDDSELGESEKDRLGEGEGATAAATQPANTLLASPDDNIRPGTDELQSYSTGRVTEEMQVGSQNGILADSQHGFDTKPSKGRVILFGKKSGLFFDRNGETTWSIHSNSDKESGGVCLMTAYNNDVMGIKVCHTDQTTGMWKSGNVGITGNLQLEGKDSVLDVERLHVYQTNVNHNGYVLKVGTKEPTLVMGVSEKVAWLKVTDKKLLLLNAAGNNNVGFGTETPADKMHVGGTMAVNKIFVGDKATSTVNPNSFRLKSGTGWKMTDADWLRVIGDKGIEAQAGAYFTDKVGVNFNWKTMPSKAQMRINDGKIAVTRKFGTSLKGVAYFYDDSLTEGRVYAKDFTTKKWAPMRWEADAIIFNPDGKNPIAIGTRTPKAKYILHIEGNNKIDGHIYVAKKMKVGGKAHVANLHTPRLNVKDQRGLDGSGQEPADGVMELVIGDWVMKGETYEMKPGGTNMRLGYYKDYCWIQMWPKGQRGSPLVLNGAGNRVGFGTTRPLTNMPGSGSQLLFHVDGNMKCRGQLVVKGDVTQAAMMNSAETLLDVGFDESATMLHHLNAQKPKAEAAHFGDSEMHKGGIGLGHVAATLTRSMQHHQSMLDEQTELLAQHESRLAKLDAALARAAK